jgi:pimeloyl-ACP methyl ester carboxylesterase
LERIVDGDLEPVILVDFAQFTATDTVANLLGTADAGRGVYRADAVQDFEAAGGTMSLDQLADGYAREAAELPGKPAAVVGYCSAATLAMELANRLPDTAVILVEPSWLTPDLIGAEAQGLRATLGAPDGPGIGFAEPLTLSAVVDTLHADLVRKFTAEGLSDDELDMCVSLMVERYRAWFGFLFTSAETPLPRLDRPVTIVMSRDGNHGVWPSWPPGSADAIRLPMTRAELLGSPAVRERIYDLVGSAR